MIERGVKTGTLKPPKPRQKTYTDRDFTYIADKAKELCRSSQNDVVVYYDERDTISMRVVRDATTMHISRFILKSYQYAKVKLTERKRR